MTERNPELEESKRPCSAAEEVVGYVWDQTPGEPPKEAPAKDNDHSTDALRYVMALRDLGAHPHIGKVIDPDEA
jgi:phage terminase large subunit